MPRTPLGETAKEYIKLKSTEDKETGCWNWSGYKSAGYGMSPNSYWMKYYKVTRGHQLSYIAFKGLYDRENLVIAHLCHNKACVNPVHLLACTAQENLEQDIFNQNSRRYLDCDVDEIYNDLGKLTNSQICKKYNISFKRLKTLTKDYKRNRGIKLSERDIEIIFEMKNEGHKQSTIARLLECSESAISRILNKNRRA